MIRPAFILTLFLIAGLFLGTFIEIPIFILLSLSLIIIVNNIYSHVKAKKQRIVPPSGITLFLCITLIGIFIQNRINLENTEGNKTAIYLENFKTLEVRGIIERIENLNEEKTVLILTDLFTDRLSQIKGNDKTSEQQDIVTNTDNFSSFRIFGKMKLTLRKDAAIEFISQNITVGDLIIVRGSVMRPFQIRNPNSMDYRNNLYNRKIYYQMNISNGSYIEVKQAPNKPIHYKFLSLIFAYREYTKIIFYNNLIKRSCDTANAIFSGNTNFFDRKQYENYKRSGLLHIFAVSGLHTTMIAFVLYFIFQLFNFSKGTRTILTVISLLIYVTLTGFSPSAIRAFIMVSSLLIANLLKRPVGLIESLSFACLVTLLVNPRSLWSPSFQLSYISVFFIIINTPLILHAFKIKTDTEVYFKKRLIFFINNILVSTFLTSLIVNISLYPILTEYFHQISIIAPLTNIIAIPLGFVILAFSLLGVTFGGVITGLQPFFFIPVEIASKLLDGLASVGGELRFAAVNCQPLPFWAIAVFYTIILTSRHFITSKSLETLYIQRWRSIIHYLGAIAFILFLKILILSSSNLYAVFLDVGQGDSTYVNLPSGENIIVDTGRGGSYDIGENIVMPFLWSVGIDNIDALFLTHPDSDHIGGAKVIIKNFGITRLIVTEQFKDDEAGIEILKIAEQNKIPIIFAKKGMCFFLGETKMQILNPDETIKDLSDNDNSIVIRLSYKDIDILFMGDSEKTSEKNIMNSNYEVESEILKVAHHGSVNATSTEFLAAAKPKIAIISVGKKNPYNHPSPKVIENLEKSNIQIFRTDDNGSIQVKTNGKTYSVIPYTE